MTIYKTVNLPTHHHESNGGNGDDSRLTKNIRKKRIKSPYFNGLKRIGSTSQGK